MHEYNRHEFSALYRTYSAMEQEELNQNLIDHGFDPNHPIVLWRGEVLDGWNRYVGCQQTGVEPVFVDATELGIESDLDALQYVIRSNSVRRHESPSQRAAQALKVAKRLEELTGQRPKIREIAEAAGTSMRTVSRVKSLPEDVIDAVADGEKIAEVREQVAPEEEQAESERPKRSKPKMSRIEALLHEIARLEAENNELIAEKTILQDRINALQDEMGSDNESLRANESLRGEIRFLKGQINLYLRDINELKKENAWLKKRNQELSPR